VSPISNQKAVAKTMLRSDKRDSLLSQTVRQVWKTEKSALEISIQTK
jgi:hypothetical protein